MRGLAEILYPLFWRLLPQNVRERLSGLILKFQARTVISVPVNAVTVFSKELRAKWPERGSQPLPAYSLIATCRNEKENIESWLDSVLHQQHPPQEFILLDGGSTDGTPELVEKWKSKRAGESGKRLPFELQLIRSPRCNIAQGRNRAAARARLPLLAFADAGCELDRFWAERLLEPFLRDEKTEVSMGWYRPITASRFEAIAAEYITPQLADVLPETFLPSARSLALRKEVFERSGGFPEFLSLAGEDSLFDYYLKSQARNFAFVPDAIAYWKFPQSFPRIFRTVRNYARGDAEGGKLFWLYYSNLLRAFGLFGLEAGVALFFLLLFDLWPLRLFQIAGAAAGVAAVIRYCAIILGYRPFGRSGLSSRDSWLRCSAVQGMVWAQLTGFIRGLCARRRVERRRREAATGGAAILFLPLAPLRGDVSESMDCLRRYLDSSVFVTLVYAGFPKKADEPIYDHQFLDLYQRSAFHLQTWIDKQQELKKSAVKGLLIRDLCNDALTREMASELLRCGAVRDDGKQARSPDES
jgi:glycosyltransferase involved in cell wall biosynthesis